MKLNLETQENLYKFYDNQIKENILFFWNRAIDENFGGIFTCFNNFGDKLISKDKYIWSQGRYLWLLSKIVELSKKKILDIDVEKYEIELHKTFNFLEKNVFLENGHVIYLMDETGGKKEAFITGEYDSSFYADCFILIGFSKYINLYKKYEKIEILENIYNSILERVQNENFKSEPYPIPLGYEAHAVNMILINVIEEVRDTFRNLNNNHKSLIKLDNSLNYYIDKILNDFCDENFSIKEMLTKNLCEEETLLARHRNPGHTLECMWFIISALKPEKITEDILMKISKIVKKAFEIGWDDEFGGLLRFVDQEEKKPKGKSKDDSYSKLINETWDYKLWWPHSEALYVSLLMYKLTSDIDFFDMYKKTEKYVFEKFPNPDNSIREWIQILDRKGNPIDKIVALPVKDPFHILRNFLLIIELLKKQEENQK